MPDTNKNEDDEFNDTLKRMLKTPPKPKIKDQRENPSDMDVFRGDYNFVAC